MTFGPLQTQILALQALAVPGGFQVDRFLDTANRFQQELERVGAPTIFFTPTIDLLSDPHDAESLDHTAAEAFLANARSTGLVPLHGEDSETFRARLEKLSESAPVARKALPFGPMARLFMDREEMIRLFFHDEANAHDLVPSYQIRHPLSGLSLGDRAEVYQALDRIEGRLVALKIYGTLQPVEDIPLSGILNELRFQSNPPGETVVRAFQAGRTRMGMPYLTLELMEGGSLRNLMKEMSGLPQGLFFEKALPIVRQMATAVAIAHAQGTLHRDIKPDNFFLTKDLATVKLGDFGIAIRKEEIDRYSPATGTRSYLPPEFLDRRDSKNSFERDVFSLGLTFYEFLTGLPTYKIMEFEGIPPSVANPGRGLTADMDALILKAMHRDPSRRYPTAVSMIEEIESIWAF